MIILYDETATEYVTLGIKVLQPLSAVVRKEDNGDYFLQLRDSADNSQLYQHGRIIAVDTPWGRQPFRIDTAPVKGSKVDVKAWHIWYDAKNYIIADSYVVEQNANYALDHINSATDATSPFTTISDVTAIRSLRVVRDSLYEAVLQIIARWGGHLNIDDHEIGISTTIGQDRGVTIAYGKNITDYGIGEDWANVVTKILPVGKNGLLLDATYVEDNPTDYPQPYTKVVSFDQNNITEDIYRDPVTNELDEAAYTAALKSDLAAQATTYLAQNHVPKVNYSFSAFIEGITDVGDVIRVNHPRLNTPLVTNVLAIEYNPIAERIDKVEFGNFNPKLSDLVSTQDAKVEAKVASLKTEVDSNLTNRLLDATTSINNILGNSYVVYDGDQILVVDSLPKETATNVMRINAGGIGFSTSGINGTFNSAWTIDGTLDMQQANVINLVADMIKGGTLQIGFSGGNNGLIEIYDQYGNQVGQIDQDGIVLNNPNGDRLEISPTTGLSAFSTAGGTEREVFSIDRDVTDIAKLHARDQIEMPPVKIVPITSGVQAGWAFVKLDA